MLMDVACVYGEGTELDTMLYLTSRADTISPARRTLAWYRKEPDKINTPCPRMIHCVRMPSLGTTTGILRES